MKLCWPAILRETRRVFNVLGRREAAHFAML